MTQPLPIVPPNLVRETSVSGMDGLSSVLTRMNVCVREAEADFLTIGERLRDYAQMAKSISVQGREASDVLTGDAILDAIRNLEEFLIRIRRYLDHNAAQTAEQTRLLEAVYAVLINLDGPMRNFSRMVKELNMLSLGIRIENARLERGQEAFSHLVDDVIGLAQQIEQKSKEMQEKIRRISASGTQEFQAILNLERAQNERTTEILFGMDAQLRALVEERRHSSERAQAMAQVMDGVGGEIGQMIQALQYHDIVRQMTEHVDEALAPYLTSSPALLTETQDEARSLCHLQAAQVREARQRLVGATVQLRESVSAIGTHMEALLHISQSSFSDSDQGHLAVIHQIKQGITQVTGSLNETVKGGFELRRLIALIVAMVRDVEVFVDDIDGIGSEIELVAQNGVIHAVPLGEAGNTLSVLAEAIQKLSLKSRHQIGELVQRLTEIGGHTQHIRIHADQGEDQVASLELVGRLSSDLLNLVQTLESVDTEVVTKMEQVDAMALRFREDLMGLQGTFSHDHEVIEALDEAAAALQQWAGDADAGQSSVDEAALKEVSSRYTMATEREVHAEFLGEERPASRKSTMQPVTVEEPVWDDNIELF